VRAVEVEVAGMLRCADVVAVVGKRSRVGWWTVASSALLIGAVCAAPSSRASESAGTKPTVEAIGKGGLSMEDLRQKLSDRIEEVKSKQDKPAVSARQVARAGVQPAAVRAAAQRGEKAGAGSHGEHGHWSYAGEGGPGEWGQLKPEFATCAAGQRQSPIDIREGIRVDLEPIKFDYRPAGFNVVDNGHTVQVNLGAGSFIEVNQRRYELVQFHFHRPSEERVNGRQYDMVAHLVHKDLDGRLAVVAVLIERGGVHPVIQQVWNSLPLEKNEAMVGPGPLNPALLLPQDKRYYTYMGSLTTPPCSEGVLWMVMKQPVNLSDEQISIFARLYPMNARPIQAGAGRLIKESN
jgi:carbonic anhydrase